MEAIMVPIDIGTFSFFHKTEQFRRTWYLWGTPDELGQLVCIHIGISGALTCARGELRRTDCTDELTKYAFKLAEERLAEAYNNLDAGDDECQVIDMDEWRNH